MNKIYLLIVFCFSVLPFLPQAQTDSGTAKPAGDTSLQTPAKTAKPIREKKDSIALPGDSIPAIDSVSIRVKDSLSLANQLATSKGNIESFHLVLKNHPYYNFFGQPIKLLIKERYADGNELFFYVLLALLFYYAFIRLAFFKYHEDLFRLFFRATLRQQQLREQLLQNSLPSLFFNILFLVSGSLYAALLLKYYNILVKEDFWRLCLYSLGVLTLIYTGKFLALRTVGWILRIGKATEIYLFTVFMVNKITGIFLLPILLLLAFPFAGSQEVIITLSLFTLAVLLGYRFLVSYRAVRNEIKLNLFHFFLYLCAFEIAPLLLVYKVLLTFIERST